MAITITINATDAIELREQLHLLLGAATVAATVKALGAGTATFDPPQGSDAAPVQVPTEQPVDSGDKPEILEQKQEVKKRRAHRKVKAGAPEPSEPSHADGAPQPESNLTAAESALTDTADKNLFEAVDPVEAQKVKDEVLPQLRDLFVSGKVKQVRAILDKFGEGAKSIPEIDAKQFPAIREFMAAGA